MGRFAVWFVQIFCFPLFVDSSTIFGKDYCFLNKGYHKNEAFLNAVSSKIQNETFITNAEYASLINYFDDDKIGDIYEVLDDKYCKETYAKQPYSHPTKHFHAYFLICDLMKKSKGSKQQRKYGKEFVKQYVTILTLISCFDNVKFEFESSGTVTDYMLQQQIRNLISFLFINFEHNLPKFCKLYDSFAIELTEKCGLDGSETLILPAGYACDNTTNPKFKWHFLAANFQYYFKNTEINHFSSNVYNISSSRYFLNGILKASTLIKKDFHAKRDNFYRIYMKSTESFALSKSSFALNSFSIIAKGVMKLTSNFESILKTENTFLILTIIAVCGGLLSNAFLFYKMCFIYRQMTWKPTFLISFFVVSNCIMLAIRFGNVIASFTFQFSDIHTNYTETTHRFQFYNKTTESIIYIIMEMNLFHNIFNAHNQIFIRELLFNVSQIVSIFLCMVILIRLTKKLLFNLDGHAGIKRYLTEGTIVISTLFAFIFILIGFSIWQLLAIIGMKEDYKYRRTQITSMNIIETCMKYSDDDAYSGGLNFLPKLMTSILLTQVIILSITLILIQLQIRIRNTAKYDIQVKQELNLISCTILIVLIVNFLSFHLFDSMQLFGYNNCSRYTCLINYVNLFRWKILFQQLSPLVLPLILNFHLQKMKKMLHVLTNRMIVIRY